MKPTMTDAESISEAIAVLVRCRDQLRLHHENSDHRAPLGLPDRIMRTVDGLSLMQQRLASDASNRGELMPNPPLTLGYIARKNGIKTWQVRRLFERRILPEPSRVGAYRVIPAEDLPLIESALRQAGYLPPEGGRRKVKR